jgi:catechol 2,3-dioxygenase-like lactoylglutathione lyase family enzyme
MKPERIDYTIVFARDMAKMRRFYQDVLGFEVARELGPQWVEYRVGENVLALTERGLMFDDAATPQGALSLQMAFRMGHDELEEGIAGLRAAGVVVDGPADQPWGHRTAFFRDPDGNVLELFADL